MPLELLVMIGPKTGEAYSRLSQPPAPADLRSVVLSLILSLIVYDLVICDHLTPYRFQLQHTRHPCFIPRT